MIMDIDVLIIANLTGKSADDVIAAKDAADTKLRDYIADSGSGWGARTTSCPMGCKGGRGMATSRCFWAKARSATAPTA